MNVPQQTLFGMIQSGLNLITQAISIYDGDLKLIHANHGFQKMFQLPDHLIEVGTDFRDLLLFVSQSGEYGPLDDIEEFVEEKIALARTFEPHYFERTRANGTTISVEGSPFDGGGWISVHTDITQIKRQEAFFQSHADDLSKELLERSEDLAKANREMAATVRALEAAKLELTESRERLQLINHMTPAHIAHVNASGIYTHSNGRLPSIIPLAAGDIVGSKFNEVLGDEIWDHVGPRFERVLAGESSVSEFREEETGRFVRLAMSPDIKPDGTVHGAYILSTDVTEEVLARLALAHARRRELATQLTSIMAHDFSNLLTIIMGQQDRLGEVAEGDALLSDISDTIKAAAGRGRDLVKSLNQIDTQRNVEPIAVNFSSFAEGLEQLARAALPDMMALEFSADIPDETVILDPGFAQDAILNLVINAAEASDGTGTVSVTIAKQGNQDLEIRVQDQGPGFTEDALSNALSPFYSTKGGKIGRGLGLTSAFDFAKSCGGNLRIRNLNSGGAAVSMKIPYQTSGLQENGLVLLVDDDDSVRKSVRGYLRRAGHIVIEASSVEEAAKLMGIDGLSCVISDLDLGQNGTGLDVVSLAPPRVPKLIITGLPTSDSRRKRAEQVCKVLSKPFAFEDLQQAMLRVTA